MTREEAVEKLEAFTPMVVDDTREALDMAIEALKELPKRRKEAKRWKRKALQAEPIKRGTWQYYVKGNGAWAVCSECGKVSIVGGNYCPNCGAKMKGTEE